MKSYPVKENPIGSAVSDILTDKQTDRQTDIVLLCIINGKYVQVMNLATKQFCIRQTVYLRERPSFYFEGGKIGVSKNCGG